MEIIDHAGLVSFASLVHGALSLGSATAYHHFSKKIEDGFRISQQFEDSVTGMRRGMVDELSTRLRPIFQNPPVRIGALEKKSYVEKSGNPIDGDRYREAVSLYIEDNKGAIVDYGMIRDYCLSHADWINRTIWLLVGLFICSVVGFVMAKCEGILFGPIENAWIICLLIISGTCVCGVIFCECKRHFASRRAMLIRSRYNNV